MFVIAVRRALACSALKLGEIDYAIAGGVNLTLHPNKYGVLKQGGDLSQTGKCASFSESADGYVPGEGVGAVLLKRYEDALRDGDHIYGVITGSLIVHAGKTNGYTVPSPKAHSKLISKVVQQAGIRSADISYIEAHGTGTHLGDAIEIHGLRQAFSIDQDSAQQGKFCSVGSVKSNIGHCESAAGMAGLTKILLQLKYQQIVPSLHSKKINKNLQIEKPPSRSPSCCPIGVCRIKRSKADCRPVVLWRGRCECALHHRRARGSVESGQLHDGLPGTDRVVRKIKGGATPESCAVAGLHPLQRSAKHLPEQPATILVGQHCLYAANWPHSNAVPPELLADSIEHLEDNLDAFLNDKKANPRCMSAMPARWTPQRSCCTRITPLS